MTNDSMQNPELAGGPPLFWPDLVDVLRQYPSESNYSAVLAVGNTSPKVQRILSPEHIGLGGFFRLRENSRVLVSKWPDAVVPCFFAQAGHDVHLAGSTLDVSYAAELLCEGLPNFSISDDLPGQAAADDSVVTQPKRVQAVGNSLHQPGSGRGPLVPFSQSDDNDQSFRPRHSRRGSFISLLRRKKDPSSKITRELSESAARLDTNLERSPEELDALRNTPLHKRGPSWPLPEPGVTGLGADQHSPERPSTAGGAIVSTSSHKSKFMRRRSASQGMVPADTADMDDDLITDAVPQKKKKFGALRKMFGLHD